MIAAAPPDRDQVGEAVGTVERAWSNAEAANFVHLYAQAVVAGDVVANRYVRLACERHLRDLETAEARDLRFEPERAGHALRFFGAIRLAEGAFANQPFKIIPDRGEEWPAWRLWQAFVVGSLAGWWKRDPDDGVWVRRFRDAYIETGKGSGKTPLGAGLCVYGLVADVEEAPEVYTAAAGRDQAAIPWIDAKRMIEKSPALRQRVDVFAHALVNKRDGGWMKSVSSEAKNLHGKRVHIALIDEEHAADGDVVGAMRDGTKGRRNALVARITNSGFDRHSVCWQDHEYSIKVLEGILEDDSWFAFVCGLDMCDEHRPSGAPVDDCAGCDDWRDEAVWPKANPNLGISITRTYLRELVRQAIGKPAQAMGIKRLCFCIWTEGSGKWLDVVAFKAAADVEGPAPIAAGRSVYAGLDLASTRDLTALDLVAPRSGCEIEGHEGRCYDLRAYFWMPAEGIATRVKRDHVPYDVWVADGWITATEGNVTDYDRIRADVGRLGDELRIHGIGVDRWNASQLVNQLTGDGFKIIPVGQGYASLSAPAKAIEADIAGGFVHHDGNPVLVWMVANAAASQDSAGNIKPDREKSSEKIDGVAAWCDALFARDGIVVEPETSSAYAGLDADQILERMLA